MGGQIKCWWKVKQNEDQRKVWVIYYLEDNRWPWKDLFLCTCKGSSLSKIPVTAHVWICSSSSRDERGRIHSYISHQLGRVEAKVGKEEDSGLEPKSVARLPSSGQSEAWPVLYSLAGCSLLTGAASSCSLSSVHCEVSQARSIECLFLSCVHM